jgi:hypothetical protein
VVRKLNQGYDDRRIAGRAGLPDGFGALVTRHVAHEQEDRNMRITSTLVAAACAVAIAGASATAAFAGEVKGPPTGGTPTSNDTAAPTHANSICAFSGLNDFTNGQNTSIVQTAADSFKYYGLPPGTPGTACQGGSN